MNKKIIVALVGLTLLLAWSLTQNLLNAKYLDGVKFGVSSCRGGIQNIVPPSDAGLASP